MEKLKRQLPLWKPTKRKPKRTRRKPARFKSDPLPPESIYSFVDPAQLGTWAEPVLTEGELKP